MGLLPPVESIRISDQSIPVLIKTDATLVMGMLSSELPKKRGLIRNTRSGLTSMRVGKRKLPRVQRLALNTRLEVDVRGAVDMPLFYLEGLETTALVRLRRIIRFSFLQRLLLPPAQDKWTALAPFHSLVNLLPEAPEVIHG